VPAKSKTNSRDANSSAEICRARRACCFSRLRSTNPSIVIPDTTIINRAFINVEVGIWIRWLIIPLIPRIPIRGAGFKGYDLAGAFLIPRAGKGEPTNARSKIKDAPTGQTGKSSGVPDSHAQQEASSLREKTGAQRTWSGTARPSYLQYPASSSSTCGGSHSLTRPGLYVPDSCMKMDRSQARMDKLTEEIPNNI